MVGYLGQGSAPLWALWLSIILTREMCACATVSPCASWGGHPELSCPKQACVSLGAGPAGLRQGPLWLESDLSLLVPRLVPCPRLSSTDPGTL